MKKVTSQTLAGLSICFDLDGTVVDTAPDLVRVTNEVIAGRGHVDAMQTEFLDRYASSIDLLSLPFPGVVQTLGDLLALGADLSICTNKPGWLARPLLRKLDLDHYFTRIIGKPQVTEMLSESLWLGIAGQTCGPHIMQTSTQY